MEGHSRSTHRDCPMNPGNAGTFIEQLVITTATTNSAACPHCGREGHSRRSHSNCAMNFTAQNRASYLNIARGTKKQRWSNGCHMLSCEPLYGCQKGRANPVMATPVVQACCAADQAILRQLASLPEEIVNLLKNNDAESKGFKENIRSYNSALSLTSMNADLDRRYANNQHGAYAFRIHDGVYHLMSSILIPDENNAVQQPRVAQIYIFDSRSELQNRMNVAGNQGVSRETTHILQNMMHEVNPFVDLLKSMEELSSEPEGGLDDIRMVFRAENSPDSRRYNAPTADEVGVLTVGGDDESDLESRNKDIVLRFKGVEGNDDLSRINELNQHYDALHYVLMLPFGDPGWNVKIKFYKTSMMEANEPVAVG